MRNVTLSILSLALLVALVPLTLAAAAAAWVLRARDPSQI